MLNWVRTRKRGNWDLQSDQFDSKVYTSNFKNVNILPYLALCIFIYLC